jgi:two-component system sensor histidine kinase/response regulator
LRILLIDDASAYREAFAELLTEGGFADAVLDYADNADDGARIMNRGEHDIYFVDYRLPGAKGTDLIQAARQAGIDRPIFCLTGLDNPNLDLEAENAGASFYLSKDDLTPGALSRTIRFSLRQSAAPPMPRDAEDRFRLAQEAANIGTWDWEIATGTMTWEKRMYQLYGCGPCDNGNECATCDGVAQPLGFAAIEQMARACMKSGAPLQNDFEVTWRDGSVHFMRAACRTLKDAAGKAVRVSGIAWDITELRELVAELAIARDAAEHANLAKSRFLAGMTHELRTPLNSILGCARLLRGEGALNPAQAARVDIMLNAGAHLLELIHCVLDLSEIETERVTLMAEPVDLRTLAAACLDMVRTAAEEKGLAIHLAVTADVPHLVMADPVRLRQILLNLLGNAVKFTARGSVDLRLRTTSEAASLRFDVADTGPGIPEEKRHRLFQDFGRLQGGLTRALEGAGLGLAISERLATLMGGRLDYMENAGGGSVFFLEIPLTEAHAPSLRKQQTPPVSEVAVTNAPHPLHILVVDDSEMNLDIAASFVRLAGHRVTCASGGAEAVAAAASTLFDAVMMDVQMPDIDGLEATRRIRALPGPNGRVPVVALTAQVFTEQLEACRQAGMTGHLAKPFNEAALYAMFADVAPGAPPDRRAGASFGWDPGGLELPVLDLHVFTTNTRLLRPAAIVTYLENIVANTASLLASLRALNGTGPIGDDLLRAVHKLAGNVGLFGFARAADAARRFERAARTGAADQHDLAKTLIAALLSSLQEAESRLTVARSHPLLLGPALRGLKLAQQS